jgi:hypothetical protein
MEWGTVNSDAIVDQGSPLGKTKRASAQGISDIKNSMTGYVIIQAESHEAAAKLFENHPHFAILPGDSVEIMECLPLRGSERARGRESGRSAGRLSICRVPAVVPWTCQYKRRSFNGRRPEGNVP